MCLGSLGLGLLGLLLGVTGTALPALLLLPGASAEQGHAQKTFYQENGYFMMGEADSWVVPRISADFIES